MSVDIENCRVVKITGHQCPKGEKYALAEIENPVRILTSTVLTDGLPLKLVPVRTNKPIPKDKLLPAMEELGKIRLKIHVRPGDVIVTNFLEPGVNLIATREA